MDALVNLILGLLSYRRYGGYYLGLGFKGLGFKGLGFGGLGFRGLVGFWVQGSGM